MTTTFANLPALLEAFNKEDQFQNQYGKPSHTLGLSQPSPDIEGILTILNIPFQTVEVTTSGNILFTSPNP